MDDDKQDKPGSGDAAKRQPPTIELTASDVTESAPASDASPETSEAEKTAPENSEAQLQPKSPSRVAAIFMSASPTV